MADDRTLARIQYILDNYDEVYKGKGSSYLRMNDKTSAPTAVFTKKVDDHYVVAVVEADNTDTAKVVSAYIANENGIKDDIKKGKLTRLSHSVDNTLPRTPEANSLSSSFDSTLNPNGEVVNHPEGTPRYMAEDIGLRGDEGGIKEEFPWVTPEEPPRVEVNGEAPSEVQPELLNKMDDRYRTNEYTMKNKSSKTVSNADRRIDTEYADELMEKGIDRYWSQSHKQQYSDAREAVSSDYDGNLNKYLNNDGSMYTGTDYNAIRILEEDIKAKRKGAIAEGNEELANKYTEQLEKLATTRRLQFK